MPKALSLLLVAAVLLAGCSSIVPISGSGSGTASDASPVPNASVHANVAPAPANLSDPPRDRLGWEGGYWYNESLHIDQSNGLNKTEIAAVVNRTMARVEYIRGLEFTRTVPVRVISRQRFKREQGNGSTTPPSRRQFDNLKYEALFMVNESTDSIQTQSQNSGASIGGYYSPSKHSIVIVTDNPSGVHISTPTLAHELTHALQDQHFDITRYNQSTRRDTNAVEGIVEGDANLVEYLYKQQCKGQWSCLRDTSGASANGSNNATADGGNASANGTKRTGDSGGLANMGPYLIKYQPYSDGPAFVYQRYRTGGWQAVNKVYKNPPASTEQVIHPNRYPKDVPAKLRVHDRTSGAWHRLKPAGRVNYGQLGEVSLSAMLVYPLYTKPGAAIVDPHRWLNLNASGKPRSFDPLNYANEYTDGYDGDRFVGYVDAQNRTGYVWKIRMDNASAAKEFLRGYDKLFDYRNASKVKGASGPGTVYRIPNDDPNGFGDAFRVTRQKGTITIVNAPTTEGLSKVHAESKQS